MGCDALQLLRCAPTGLVQKALFQVKIRNILLCIRNHMNPAHPVHRHIYYLCMEALKG